MRQSSAKHLVLMGACLVAPGCGIQQARQAALTAETANNMKQIGLACHIHHDEHGRLPANIQAPDGTPLLSWRVAILPYVEEEALYRQFRLNEPWDSPHNKPLAEQLPKLFLDPRLQKREERLLTHFQGFVGDGGVLGSREGLRLDEIEKANGLANTFLVVEAADPVPWTKPADLIHNANQPLPKLADREGFGWAIFANLEMQRIPTATPEKTLRCMIRWDNTEKFERPK